MKSDERIQREVEETLRSYDRDPILEGNPFLMTRIEAARKSARTAGTHGFVPFRALRVLAFLLLLLVNLATIIVYRVRVEREFNSLVVSQLQIDFQMDESLTNF